MGPVPIEGIKQEETASMGLFRLTIFRSYLELSSDPRARNSRADIYNSSASRLFTPSSHPYHPIHFERHTMRYAGPILEVLAIRRGGDTRMEIPFEEDVPVLQSIIAW